MKKLFTFAVFLALSFLLGNSAMAQKRAVMKLTLTHTIDFSVYGGAGQPNNARLSFSNGHPQINGTTISDRLSLENTNDWQFYGSNTFNETYLQKKDNNNNTSNVYISDMNVGDVVTIWGESGDNNGGCVVASGNTDFTSNMTFNNDTPSYSFTMTNSGRLTLQFFNRYSGIRKITI